MKNNTRRKFDLICFYFYSYQEASSSTSFREEGVDTRSFQGYNDESRDWNWSDTPKESNASPIASTSTASKSKTKPKTGDDLLIDFGESSKAKNSASSVKTTKVKTVEEEAWDMLNS